MKVLWQSNCHYNQFSHCIEFGIYRVACTSYLQCYDVLCPEHQSRWRRILLFGSPSFQSSVHLSCLAYNKKWWEIIWNRMKNKQTWQASVAVGCAVRLETRRSPVQPRRGRQHSFVEIDHEIFSMVILSLLLIQEGQLSVSGEKMCTKLVNRLED